MASAASHCLWRRGSDQVGEQDEARRHHDGELRAEAVEAGQHLLVLAYSTFTMLMMLPSSTL